MWEWILDGIGTELISLLIGTLGCCIVGYKIRNKIFQKQKAGDNSNQFQTFTTSKSSRNCSNYKNISKISQIQKAGNDSVQKQEGDIKND